MDCRKIFLPFALFAALSSILHAQAKLAIYGTVGGEKTEVANEGWTTAGTFGLY